MTDYPPLARQLADQPRICTCAMHGPGSPRHRASVSSAAAAPIWESGYMVADDAQRQAGDDPS